MAKVHFVEWGRAMTVTWPNGRLCSESLQMSVERWKETDGGALESPSSSWSTPSMIGGEEVAREEMRTHKSCY